MQREPPKSSGGLKDAIGTISGLIGIFAFLTGVHSLPAILTSAHSPETAFTLSDAAYFWPLLVFTQTGFYVCFFHVLRRIHDRFAKRDSEEAWFIVFLAVAIGFTLLFEAAYWGPFSGLPADKRAGPVGFVLFAICIDIGVAASASRMT